MKFDYDRFLDGVNVNLTKYLANYQGRKPLTRWMHRSTKYITDAEKHLKSYDDRYQVILVYQATRLIFLK